MILESSSRALLKILETKQQCYVFADRLHSAVVVFTFPSIDIARKLFQLCDLGIMPSTEVEDYIWDKHVLYYLAEDKSEQLTEACKVNLSNAIFFWSIELDATHVERNMAMANNLFSSPTDLVGAYMELSNHKSSIYESNIFKYHYDLLLAVQQNQKTPQEFLNDFYKMVNGEVPTQKQTRAQPEKEMTVEEALASMRDVPYDQPNGSSEKPTKQRVVSHEGGRQYGKHTNAEEARQDPTYAGIFDILDKISAGEITPEEIEQANPTRIIGGGNEEIIDGKIIDDNSFVPSRRKKASRRLR